LVKDGNPANRGKRADNLVWIKTKQTSELRHP